jgi:hypothetical protein
VRSDHTVSMVRQVCVLCGICGAIVQLGQGKMDFKMALKERCCEVDSSK